ncbi:MAG: Arc family DNA-binding protein [Treponema sp.]|nr:Arc family DNA-binding protein [Treponema sp.]
MGKKDVIQAEDKDAKKQFLLRLSDSLWKELSAWAQDDFRSINGQIEFLLSECVKKRKNNK